MQDIIACMNEISQLHKVVDNKKQFLEILLQSFPRLRSSFEQSTFIKRADTDVLRCAEHIQTHLENQDLSMERLPLLSEELKSSLDVVSPYPPNPRSPPSALTPHPNPQFFQLKTIQQNEMALLAESNSQAILVFTVVTVVFLPLSFFTSYFGMNLQGIANTEMNEKNFWMVCGPVTVSIVLLTLVFGFRKRFKDKLWSDETFARVKS